MCAVRREDKEAMKVLQAVNLMETLQELKQLEPEKLLDMMAEWKKLIEEETYSQRVANITLYMLQYAYRHAAGAERHKKSTSYNHERSAKSDMQGAHTI